ncbi:MAG: NADH-quinone oxidoreductase subunit G [Candidatus Tokpelaia sp. JSC161]|jgi:NADH-quinone oxidoreductase subunit G|nr:MAG: NADH-quinone oxidoreductase subunit G [Candidatus Tokpelaia sp. JSC161]
MAEIKVNGKKIDVPDHYTLLQAAEAAGAEIPRFCFHERLSIAGNCRMCLVEVKGGPPKPITSCAMGVLDLRTGPHGELPEIFTETDMVKKSRKGVLEFILINHPLDCPICDQGGECDLQDQTMLYGRDFSRYTENKRAVEDKYIGPLIKTVMTRCIHCTRCVRFTTEVAGLSELGFIGRGEDSEITTFLEHSMTSELQGNLIDLCPVGALTSRPYAFQARSWELTKTDTIDVMDALGSAIRVDSRGAEVMRILPRVNEAVNEEWISDKTRFIWDGLRKRRLDRPYLRNEKNYLISVSWEEAFSAIRSAVLKSNKAIGALAGDLATVEEMYALKLLLQSLGSDNIDCRQDGTILNPSFGRSTYIFNPTIAGIEDSDTLLIIGSNPRIEGAVLNARIRKRQGMGHYPIGLIGAKTELRYRYHYLGPGLESLNDLVLGNGIFFKILKKAKKPIILIGQGALIGKEGTEVLRLSAKLACNIEAVRNEWNGFAILHTAASRVGGLDIGFVCKNGKTASDILNNSAVLFLLGADECDVSTARKKFVVYIGSHGDKGARLANVVLPGATYTEKSGLYVNTEGRLQMTNAVGFPPGQAKEDWAILRALSDVLGCPFSFNSLYELRSKLIMDYPHFKEIDDIFAGKIDDIFILAEEANLRNFRKYAFTSPIQDFYLTNPIARASAVMRECSSLQNKHISD